MYSKFFFFFSMMLVSSNAPRVLVYLYHICVGGVRFGWWRCLQHSILHSNDTHKHVVSSDVQLYSWLDAESLNMSKNSYRGDQSQFTFREYFSFEARTRHVQFDSIQFSSVWFIGNLHQSLLHISFSICIYIDINANFCYIIYFYTYPLYMKSATRR